MNNSTARTLRRYSSLMFQRARKESVQGDTRRLEPMTKKISEKLGSHSPGHAKLKAWYLALNHKQRGSARQQMLREIEKGA